MAHTHTHAHTSSHTETQFCDTHACCVFLYDYTCKALFMYVHVYACLNMYKLKPNIYMYTHIYVYTEAKHIVKHTYIICLGLIVCEYVFIEAKLIYVYTHAEHIFKHSYTYMFGLDGM